jgi:hypothetical protein
MLRTRTFLISFALGLAACEGSRGGGGGDGTNPPPPPPTRMACGNGVLNGFEACDGISFAEDATCATLGLRSGELRCSSTCTLDLSQCEVRDYCMANNLYGNGACDSCELLGGQRDPDCETACGMDGMCADRFDPLTNNWTCRRIGMTDPDCGTCGNSTLDGNELCDGRAFVAGKITCSDYGFLGGELGCKSDCSPNFAACTFSTCGDGNREAAEECDGPITDGSTCESRGYAGGMLTCTTCRISEAQCIAPGCGNNIQEDGPEECDGTDLADQSCTTRGFAGGTLACNGACAFDDTACVSPGCGNMIIESNEDCEGANLNGGSCEMQGFLGGTLGCSPTSCTFDTAQCVAPGCGNMIVEPATEDCEGSNLGGGSCMSEGFAGGTLACRGDCQFDTSMCIARGCGNNIIEAPMEQCEGANLGTGTCQNQGFAGGTLACDGSCRYDTSMCLEGGCGNGIAEPPAEQCDGNDLRGGSCAMLGYTGGTIACGQTCTYDASGCTGGGPICGDGVRQGLEFCDGNTFPANFNRACSTFGLGTGQVNCLGCNLSFSACQNTDFCGAQNPSFYGDGVCDWCQSGTAGMRDSMDCGFGTAPGACAGNGTCVEYYDPTIDNFTCQALYGTRDPDCGCNDGTLSPPQNGFFIELCDGNQFNVSASCTDYGFTSGTVHCDSGCGLDFSNCL